MKAGLYNTRCIIMRKRVISGDYRDKEVWENHVTTKCNFDWTSGHRNIESKEIFYANTATVTVRSYVDVQEEDHVWVHDTEYRIVAMNKQIDSTHNCITLNVEKLNK